MTKKNVEPIVGSGSERIPVSKDGAEANRKSIGSATKKLFQA